MFHMSIMGVCLSIEGGFVKRFMAQKQQIISKVKQVDFRRFAVWESARQGKEETHYFWISLLR